MKTLSRRAILKGFSYLTAASLTPFHSAFAKKSTPIDLVAAPSTHQFKEGGAPSSLWSYNATTPGPVLKFRQGDKAKIRFKNALSQSTSVHWHGIRIANAMDGVSGLTQDPIASADTFLYDFDLPDAGTYWYHPHNRSWEQLARGLYGALIIEEKSPYPVDRDEVVLLDDWRVNEKEVFDEESLGNRHDWSHGGRLGNFATVNGKSRPSLTFRPGERVRLRFINASNARVFSILIPALSATLIALDGQPLNKPQPFTSDEPLVLAPAQRADVIVDMTEKAVIAMPTRNGQLELATLNVQGDPLNRYTGQPVPALPSNNVPRANIREAFKASLIMEGGAMRWLVEAEYQGEKMDGRSLAQKGQFWSFNGVSGKTHKPFFSVQRDRSVVMEIQNNTAWPHAMHLHGHHFEVIKPDQAEDMERPLRDTVLMQPQETLKIAFVADNPGRWMFHCHMLEHQAAGMGTWFEVT